MNTRMDYILPPGQRLVIRDEHYRQVLQVRAAKDAQGKYWFALEGVGEGNKYNILTALKSQGYIEVGYEKDPEGEAG